MPSKVLPLSCLQLQLIVFEPLIVTTSANEVTDKGLDRLRREVSGLVANEFSIFGLKRDQVITSALELLMKGALLVLVHPHYGKGVVAEGVQEGSHLVSK